MKYLDVTVLFLILFFGSSDSSSVFRFANIYGSHMVLQKAPQRAIIWGFGEVGQEVLLTAADEVYRSIIIEGKLVELTRMVVQFWLVSDCLHLFPNFGNKWSFLIA